jgi:hypothetical protein
MMRILIVSLFLSFCIFFGVSSSQETGIVHKAQPHRHKQYAKEKNPVPMSEKSIEKGRELFEKYCDKCHGEKGAEKVKEANLMDDVFFHGDSDGEIYHVITDGVRESTMKGFKKELTNEMRWNAGDCIGKSSGI